MCHQFFYEQAAKVSWTMDDLQKIFTNPPVEKFLMDPPQMPPGMVFPKTLILNLGGTLVTSDYEFGVGFQYRKRPHLKMFLDRVSKGYEVVIFGDEETTMIYDVGQALDPEHKIFSGMLGHEHTSVKGNKLIKDLSYMNRDVKKCLVIDCSDEHFLDIHQGNVLKIPKWDGDKSDHALLDLIPFLEHLADPRHKIEEELRTYTRDRTSEEFNKMQRARLTMINKQRDSGFSGMLGKLKTSSGPSHTDDEEFNVNTGFQSNFRS